LLIYTVQQESYRLIIALHDQRILLSPRAIKIIVVPI